MTIGTPKDTPRLWKTHKKKMHNKTKNKEECSSFSKQCDLCEKVIKNNIEIKAHMKTHSYIKAEY